MPKKTNEKVSKSVKAWAILNPLGEIYYTFGNTLEIYPTQREAKENEFACSKVVRVLITEITK